MALAATFLGGAKSRLLPASIPFRYFAAAALFHILAWLHFVLAGSEAAAFTGGPGIMLAAIHLLTLGVFVMTAMGAAFQLLPVATQRPLARIWPARACFWLLVPGTLVLVHGMETASTPLMHGGAVLVTASLLLFAMVIGFNLRIKNAMAVVAAHGWGALASLLVFVVLALALIADFDSGFLADHSATALAHMVLAAFGFMGMLAFGFSHVLIPMFALSRTFPPNIAWAQFWLASTAVVLGGYGAIGGNSTLLVLSVCFALAATTAYLWLMYRALSSGMRKRLGLSFVMIKASWAMLVICLLLGLALTFGFAVPNGSVLFGFLLIAGWLLTFLTGVLQRILPFLASMHATGKGGKPAMLSELTANLPLKIHAVCHCGAVLVCSAGIIAGSSNLIRGGATLGTAGALAFAIFVFLIVAKLRKPAI